MRYVVAQFLVLAIILVYDKVSLIIMRNQKAFETANAMTEQVNLICAPLFENTEVCYFGYTRYFDNSNALALVSEIALVEFALTEDYYPRRADLDEMPDIGIITRAHSDRGLVICDVLQIDHALRFKFRHKSFYDVALFGSKSSHISMYDFYLNNLSLLNGFIFYFKSNADSLFKKSMDKPFKLPKFNTGYVEPPYEIVNTKDLKAQLSDDVLEYKYQLSPREKECLNLLAKGCSAKVISNKLDLSINTVHFYISNLKSKTNCRKLADLLKVYYLESKGL